MRNQAGPEDGASKAGVCRACAPGGWNICVEELGGALRRLEATGPDMAVLGCDQAFVRFKKLAEDARTQGRVIYLVGNGASASMASHFAADLAKNAHLHTQVFTDISLITAVANDLCYEEVFVEPLRRRMRQGDMLVCISSSGNSKNVVNAATFAGENGGTVVTLSAMKPDNALRRIGALNFWVPADAYGLAETAHAAVLHYWMDAVSLYG